MLNKCYVFTCQCVSQPILSLLFIRVAIQERQEFGIMNLHEVNAGTQVKNTVFANKTLTIHSRRRVRQQPRGVLCPLWHVTLVGRNLLPYFSIGVQTCSLCRNLHDQNNTMQVTVKYSGTCLVVTCRKHNSAVRAANPCTHHLLVFETQKLYTIKCDVWST